MWIRLPTTFAGTAVDNTDRHASSNRRTPNEGLGDLAGGDAESSVNRAAHSAMDIADLVFDAMDEALHIVQYGNSKALAAALRQPL
jgi:hypothetical protein